MRLPGFLKRQLDVPTPGTENTIWPQAAAFFDETFGAGGMFSPRLAERVWVANRCIQLNAQQIAAMPLRFMSTAPGGGYEPAWTANPDPVWFPNGIGDAVFAIVKGMYGWGYSLLLVTSRYVSGYPAGWTVIPPESQSVEAKNGRREYRANGDLLNPDDVVQIDRNPGGLHGTSALRAYASLAWGLINSSNLASTTMAGGIPTTVLKPKRKIEKDQARDLQDSWMAAMLRRNGAPAVLPPEVDFEVLSFSPKDLLLLDAQQFTARALASAFGVPAFLLNLPMEGSLIYQNPQMLGEFWWRFELRSTAKRLADALTANMLPRGNAVVFESSDTFAPLTEQTTLDDSQVVNASPADEGGAVVAPLRPMEMIG